MGNVAIAPLPLPRLASLDWPPPPSPATSGFRSRGHVDGAVGLGATTPAGAAAELEEQQRRQNTRPAEIKARAGLWALRGDIEREKLRSVAPFPFFGRAMRFQDEFCALQITDDGRFSYSTIAFVTATDAAERAATAGSAAGRDPARRITTYEGILAAPDPFADADDGGAAEQPAQEDPAVASIEGRAIARHEIESDHCGRTRLTNAERSAFRFAITVNTFFQPQSATIQPLAVPRSPGRPPPRKRQLPYVGTGSSRRPNASDAELRRQRRQGPKLKFSKTMAPPGQTLQTSSTSEMTLLASESRPGLPKLAHSSSLPQLPSLSCGPVKESTLSPHQMSQAREFQRQNSDGMLVRKVGVV